jgi:hypothetical protein
MIRIDSAGIPPRAAVVKLLGMNLTTSTERSSTREHAPEQTARVAAERSVEAIHRSTGFHWVGNGFFVSTYFPSATLAAERVSPFLLMDYGPSRIGTMPAIAE